MKRLKNPIKSERASDNPGHQEKKPNSPQKCQKKSEKKKAQFESSVSSIDVIKFFRFNGEHDITQERPNSQAMEIVKHLGDLEAFIDSGVTEDWFEDDLIVMGSKEVS